MYDPKARASVQDPKPWASRLFARILGPAYLGSNLFHAPSNAWQPLNQFRSSCRLIPLPAARHIYYEGFPRNALEFQR